MDKFSWVLPAVVFLVTTTTASTQLSKDLLSSETTYSSSNGNEYSDNAQQSQYQHYSNQQSSYQALPSYSSQSVYVSPQASAPSYGSHVSVPNYGRQPFSVADTIQPSDYESQSNSPASKSTKKTVILAIPVKLALQLPEKGQTGDKQEGQGYDTIGQAAAGQSTAVIGKAVQSYTGAYGSSHSSSPIDIDVGKSYGSSPAIEENSVKSKGHKKVVSDFESKPYETEEEKSSEFSGKLYTKSKGLGKHSQIKDSEYGDSGHDSIDYDDWQNSKISDVKGIEYGSTKGSANGNDNIDAIISSLGTPSLSSLNSLLGIGGKTSSYGTDTLSSLSGDFGIGSSGYDLSTLYEKPTSVNAQNILANILNSYGNSYSSLLRSPSTMKGIDKGYGKYSSLMNYGTGASMFPLSYGSSFDALSNYGNIAPAVPPFGYSPSMALFGKPKKSKLSGLRTGSGFDLLKLASISRPSIMSSFGSAFSASSPAKLYSPLIPKAPGVGIGMPKSPLMFSSPYKYTSIPDDILGLSSSPISSSKFARPLFVNARPFSSFYRKLF